MYRSQALALKYSPPLASCFLAWGVVCVACSSGPVSVTSAFDAGTEETDAGGGDSGVVPRAPCEGMMPDALPTAVTTNSVNANPPPYGPPYVGDGTGQCRWWPRVG